MENLNRNANGNKNRKPKKDLNGEILNLIDKYKADAGVDTKRALKENKRLEYLYALAPLRENLLEWYEFEKDARLLQVGADFGALTGLYLQRTEEVTVLDESEENLSVVRARYGAAELKTVCGGLLSFAEKPENRGSFQYVAIIGSLNGRETPGAQLEAAKKLLTPGGTLFVAVCNPFGFKYLAGAVRDADCVSERRLRELLPEGEFYYPMPDYRVPSAIYSDRYLPKKGDLTGMPALYDYPKYRLMDVGAAYDTACEDGQFANFASSYLVVWNAGERPAGIGAAEDSASEAGASGQKLGFIKYNRTRRECFQIRTQILEEEGTRYAGKTALCREGTAHIRSFEEKYESLTRQNRRLRLVKPEIAADGWTARFDYLQGRTMAELLGEELASGDFIQAVKTGWSSSMTSGRNLYQISG